MRGEWAEYIDTADELERKTGEFLANLAVKFQDNRISQTNAFFQLQAVWEIVSGLTGRDQMEIIADAINDLSNGVSPGPVEVWKKSSGEIVAFQDDPANLSVNMTASYKKGAEGKHRSYMDSETPLADYHNAKTKRAAKMQKQGYVLWAKS